MYLPALVLSAARYLRCSSIVEWPLFSAVIDVLDRLEPVYLFFVRRRGADRPRARLPAIDLRHGAASAALIAWGTALGRGRLPSLCAAVELGIDPPLACVAAIPLASVPLTFASAIGGTGSATSRSSSSARWLYTAFVAATAGARPGHLKAVSFIFRPCGGRTGSSPCGRRR